MDIEPVNYGNIFLFKTDFVYNHMEMSVMIVGN